MLYSWTAFREPRGVMRILQFIFAIAAFSTTTNFSASLQMTCDGTPTPVSRVYEFDYPFRIEQKICPKISNKTLEYTLSADLSSDAQFYVATGVLSLMYCVFIIAVYAGLDELYRTKTEIPLADFMLTTILAIFWLSGSAAWSNSTNTLKGIMSEAELKKICACSAIYIGTFSRLNISLILGFLNFFLWASDLWFLYKETIWFQGRSATQPTVTGAAGGGVPSV